MLKHFGKCIVLVMFFLLAPIQLSNAFTPHQLTLEEKEFDFIQLVNQIKNRYALLEFKEEYLGINFDDLTNKYSEMISDTKSNGEFYSLITKFIAEFKDGHFRSTIPTSYEAHLPFALDYVQDEVVVSYVNHNVLPEKDYPFKKGDIVISFDGKPVEDAVNEIIPYMQTANPYAAKQRAAQRLAYRDGQKISVPTGKVSVTFFSQDSKKEQKYEFEWLHDGEIFDEHILDGNQAYVADTNRSSIDTNPNDTPHEYNPMDSSSYRETRTDIPNSASDYGCNGKSPISIPKDATMLIEHPFVAYYYPTEKGNVGYIKIGHYYPEMIENINQSNWYENYRWALIQLEKETKGLIIDQNGNCGGSIDLMYEMASLFMTKPFKPLTKKYRASKLELLKFKGFLDTFANHYFVRYENLEKIYLFIKDATSKNERMTPAIDFFGGSLVEAKSVYTKPIIILVDHLSLSASDSFSEVMKSNGRAKLLGTTTAGYGGTVEEMERLFYSQIKIEMTTGMELKLDGTPIENYGVEPDIPYEITMNDFMNGYEDFRKFYTEKLLEMIK